MGAGRADDSTGQTWRATADVNVREVLNAIFYVLSTGCQWKALPKDLPPKSTVHYYFMLWDWDGTLERIHHALYVAAREQVGREASPTAAIIDSQSAKSGSKRGSALDPQGFDAGKKVKGRKRHILVDTLGLLLSVVVHPADVQDRDGARQVLRTARRLFPFIELHLRRCRLPRAQDGEGHRRHRVLEDRDRQAQPMRIASSSYPNDGSSSARSPGSAAIAGLRATSSATLATVAAFIRLAMIRIMLRRLTKPTPCS